MTTKNVENQWQMPSRLHRNHWRLHEDNDEFRKLFCKGPDWNKQIILYWTADIFVDTLLLEQCLASYLTTFKDMQRSLKRKAPSDDAFPNLFAKTDDEVIRSHTDLIEAIFEALPDIDFKQLYRYVKGVGIFKCNETTHIWEEILNCEFEYILYKVAKAHVPNLNTRELKNVGQFNQLPQLRHGFEAFITDRYFMDTLDSNLNLFVLQNGALDSLTKEFRPLCWDDYTSISCEWAYSSDESRLHMPEVKHFFETVLPAREERDYVLHFFGRLLDGHRDEKQFFVLTDKRDGNNGKTMFINLMECIFSSYVVCKGSKAVCEQSRESINFHDAGLARFKGIRLLIVDELKKDQTLNSSFLKRVAGGRSSVDGRNMYSSKVFKFSWQVGIVLIMNEGDFPKFDSFDEAFMKRMVVSVPIQIC
ncbi:ATPase [Caerostris darwini]|uniref:ATPase n=1 Tax=Caerostris darwini TaxID=1538125 RepID=A0AAV4VDM4_9ARAC|nr:ATPase [Caerostris darwini]